jgi:hypothetical protein
MANEIDEPIGTFVVAESSVSHTPGPWHVHEGQDYIVVLSDHTCTDEPLAEVSTLANARLIAAAPELLAIAKAVLESEQVETYSTLAIVARAAIAKVEGRA